MKKISSLSIPRIRAMLISASSSPPFPPPLSDSASACFAALAFWRCVARSGVEGYHASDSFATLGTARRTSISSSDERSSPSVDSWVHRRLTLGFVGDLATKGEAV